MKKKTIEKRIIIQREKKIYKIIQPESGNPVEKVHDHWTGDTIDGFDARGTEYTPFSAHFFFLCVYYSLLPPSSGLTWLANLSVLDLHTDYFTYLWTRVLRTVDRKPAAAVTNQGSWIPPHSRRVCPSAIAIRAR